MTSEELELIAKYRYLSDLRQGKLIAFLDKLVIDEVVDKRKAIELTECNSKRKNKSYS